MNLVCVNAASIKYSQCVSVLVFGLLVPVVHFALVSSLWWWMSATHPLVLVSALLTETYKWRHLWITAEYFSVREESSDIGLVTTGVASGLSLVMDSKSKKGVVQKCSTENKLHIILIKMHSCHWSIMTELLIAF